MSSKASEVLAFLQACGVNAELDEDGGHISIKFDDDMFFFSVDSDEEWELLKIVAMKIARGLTMQDLGLGNAKIVPQ
jgi:hypothetical protein